MFVAFSIIKKILITILFTCHVAGLQFVDTEKMNKNLNRFQEDLKIFKTIVNGSGENKYIIRPKRRCILLDECIDHLEDSADAISVLQEERTTLMDMSEALLTKVYELENRNKFIDKTKLSIKELEEKVKELEFYNDIHINQIMNTNVRPPIPPYRPLKNEDNIAQEHLDSLEAHLDILDAQNLQLHSHSEEINVVQDMEEQTTTTTEVPIPQKIDKCLEICNNFVKDITLNISTMGVYYIHSDPQTQKTWFEAQYFCRQHGMDLVTVETEEKNNWITEQILNSSAEIEELFYWTGLHNLNDKASWVWTGTGIESTFFNWKIGQPFSPSLQRCAGSSHSNNQIGWIANFCNKKAFFICEMYQPCASILN